MQKRNWKQYNKNLVKRGSVTFFIDEELLKPLKAQTPINARRGLSPERDRAISIIKGLGGDILARSIWGKLVGYSGRALVESCFSRMKRLYKGGLYSRKNSTQTVEVYLKAKVMNCMISQKKAA